MIYKCISFGINKKSFTFKLLEMVHCKKVTLHLQKILLAHECPFNAPFFNACKY